MIPEDKAFEYVILSSLMDYGDEAMDQALAGGCKTAWFTTEATQSVWESTLKLFKRDEPLGMQGVIANMRESGSLASIGGLQVVIEILEFGPNGGEFHEQAIRETRRAWLLRGAQAIGRQIEGADSLEDAQDLLGPSLAQWEQDVSGATPTPDIKTLLKSWLDNFEDRKAGKETSAIPTGIKELDEKWGGILAPGLTIISALPASGKTALLIQIINAVCERGNHSAFFSAEMTANPQVIDRLMTVAGQLDPSAIFGSDPMIEGDKLKMKSAFTRIKDYDLDIEDTSGMTVDYITARARTLHRKKTLHLVGVDYAQIIKGQRIKGDTHERELAYISTSLQDLAKELQCAVILLSQVNAQGDTKGATAFEEAADLWLHIIRDKGQDHDLGILAKKCRHRGQNGQIIPLSFSKETLTFETNYNL